MGQINIKSTPASDILNPTVGKIALGVNDSGITLKNENGEIISIGGGNVNLTNYYTSSQTNANFLSANTSFYSRSYIDSNLVNNTIFNSHTGDSSIHFTKSSILLDNLGDVDTSGVLDGYFLQYSSGTWIPVYGTSSSGSTDLSNYYNKTQVNSNFLSANTLYEFIVPIDYNWNNSSTVQSSTTFVINYIFNLSGQNITLPYNSTFKFSKDGSLQNTTIIGNYSFINSDEKGVGILYNSILSGGSFVNMTYHPEWFGSLNSTNWYNALQTAINCAQLKSGEVKLSSYVYTYQECLRVPAGVSINGVSRGETAFSAGPTLGSQLHCTSSTTNKAFEIYDKFVTLSNFTIRGESRSASNIDGLVVNAVGLSGSGANIESLNFDNILIHSCRKGMYLVAGNNGAVTYSLFNNIRIRDCIYSLKIDVLSANPIYGNVDGNGNSYISDNAFINSNKWSGLFISGYAPNCGVWINTQKKTSQVNSQDVYLPANNLQFDVVVIEPPYSEMGHLRLEGGGSQVRMHDIRIEASTQDSHYPQTPVVYLGTGTNGNYIDMDQASISVVDLGYNNTIISKGTKCTLPSPNSDNLYKNSALIGLEIESDGTYNIPYWTIQEQCVDPNNIYSWRTLQTGSSITISYTSTTRQDGYKALVFNVPPKYQLRIYQDINRDLANLTNATVNAYVIADNLKDVQWTYQDAVTGIISSSASFGNDIFSGNTYEPIGGWFPITPTSIANYYRLAVFVQNIQNTGGTDINFKLTQPQLVKGIVAKNDPAKYLTDLGGTVFGLIGRNMIKNISPVTNPSIYLYNNTIGSLLLPLDGSVFEISETGFYISKINYNINRFSRGSEITLIFDYAGVQVLNTAFINLSKDYISEIGSTLTLYSANGDGLWTELNRYSKVEYGYTTYDIINIGNTGTSFVEFPLTGEKYFNLTNLSSGTYNITRINYTNRFVGDSRIHIDFNSTNSLVSLANTGYLKLAKSGSYYPNDGDWIELITHGDGTWTETNRKQSSMQNATIGNYTLDTTSSSVLSGVTLQIPKTGENSYTITNNSITPRTITRINDSVDRLNAGYTLLLDFTTLSSIITISNSSYITLSKTGDWTPSTGDWIELYTKGNGTWVELNRKQSLNPNVTMGAITLEAASIISTNFLTLPKTGENSFTLTNTGATSLIINRINEAAATRFNAGSVILLDFASLTSGISLANSGYITLSKTGNFSPVNGDWIALYTKGNGTWTELNRKSSTMLSQTKGLSSINYNTAVSTGVLTLSNSGENYFKLSGGTGGGTITQINYVSANRLTPGTTISIKFYGIATPIILQNNNFIILSGATNYTPTEGSIITMITEGNGVWEELSRRS